MERITQDIRYALRQFRRYPGLALTVVVTLALAIGANTAIYSVLQAVLLRPLPYESPERLVMIRADVEGVTDVGVLSAPELMDLRERTRSFDAFAGIWGTTGALTGSDPEQVGYAWVTANTFPTLGIDPIVGRMFREEDDLSASENVVLIGEELWRRRFAADPQIVGRGIEVDDVLHTVIGVMPAGVAVPRGAFALGLDHYDLWMPQTFWENRQQRWLGVIGRLKPGATLDVARAELRTLAAALKDEHSEYANMDFVLHAVPVHGFLVSGVRPALMALGGAVGLVLLIACTNVAALLLVHGRSRERELAVRRALGAGRGRLGRLLVTETLLLAVAGGLAGLVVAQWCLGLVDVLNPANLPRLDDIAIDGTVLGVAASLSLLTGLACALAPVIQATNLDPGPTLKHDSRGGGSNASGRARSLLVVGQVALSLVLLVGAGLMVQTLSAVRGADTGFRPDGVVSFRVPIAYDNHQTGVQRWRFYQDLVPRVRALPGVDAVGGVSLFPLAGGLFTASYAYDADTERAWGQLAADYRTVIPGYFDAIGATIVAGRWFDDADAAASSRVTIVDETLAREAWPEGNAVGQRMKIVMNESGNEQHDDWAEVIGVVRHIRTDDLRTNGAPQIYRPFWLDNALESTIVARVSADPLGILPAVRTIARDLGSGRPIHRERLMSSYVDEAASDTQFISTLLAVFAGIAVTLTVVGLYGVVAYLVSTRTREIGVRLALGATPATVRALVLTHGLRLALIGLVIGLAAAPLLTRPMSSLIFGVTTWDPSTYVAAVLGFATVAAVACLVPARRASRVDPIVSLRTD
jgi:predicted permease